MEQPMCTCQLMSRSVFTCPRHGAELAKKSAEQQKLNEQRELEAHQSRMELKYRTQ